jgi:N-methylhydantoinase B/oxoprolinase/acetone carboxylase alpha subunit
MTFRRGEVFRHELPGSGGWGDPLERDPALVAQDLRDGFVTIEGAAIDYGIVAHGDPPQIDEAATAVLRAEKIRHRDRQTHKEIDVSASSSVGDGSSSSLASSPSAASS